MESTIGLYKSELIDRQRSWSGRGEMERETASWADWFNNTRLHSSIGYTSPIDYENNYRHNRRLPLRGGLNEVFIRTRTVQITRIP